MRAHREIVGVGSGNAALAAKERARDVLAIEGAPELAGGNTAYQASAMASAARASSPLGPVAPFLPRTAATKASSRAV